MEEEDPHNFTLETPYPASEDTDTQIKWCKHERNNLGKIIATLLERSKIERIAEATEIRDSLYTTNLGANLARILNRKRNTPSVDSYLYTNAEGRKMATKDPREVKAGLKDTFANEWQCA
jgi:hypothetical protein